MFCLYKTVFTTTVVVPCRCDSGQNY